MARRRVQDEAQGGLAAMNGEHSGFTKPHPPSSAQEAQEMADAEAALESKKVGYSLDRERGKWIPDRDGTPIATKEAKEAASNVTNIMQTAPETITVTWGEELFTPVQFCSFRVGPYTASTSLRAGESREQAADRLMRELERIAAKERDIKIRVYREGLDKVIPRKGT